MVIIPVILALLVLITKPVSVLNISVVHFLLKLEIALQHSPLVGSKTMQVNVKLLSVRIKLLILSTNISFAQIQNTINGFDGSCTS